MRPAAAFLAAGLALASACAAPPPTAPAGAGADGARAGMVVIAPREWHGVLGGFVAHRARELDCMLVALEDALAGPTGTDDPEKLKRFLFNQWRDRGARYALLVGDADVLPVRYMVLDRCTPEAFNYAFYPSDLYYADVAKADGSFEDWNAARDGFHEGYYGEVRGECTKDGPINFDGVDYNPELAVGRWPVSTAEQARTIAEKTIARDALLDAADSGDAAAWAWRAAVVHVEGWVDVRARLRAWAGTLPADWRSECYFSPFGEPPVNGDPAPPRPDEASMIALFNEGVGLVLHAGHGGDDLWEHSLSTRAIEKLSNGPRLPVVFSAGCSTARFATLPPYEAYVDVSGVEHAGTNAGQVFTSPPPPPAPYQRGRFNPTGLGERLLRDGPNGAVAYIGCNTGSQPCGLTLMEGFVAAVAARGGSVRVGDAWAEALRHYVRRERLTELKPDAGWYPPSIFFQGMKFMLFGDPAARVAR